MARCRGPSRIRSVPVEDDQEDEQRDEPASDQEDRTDVALGSHALHGWARPNAKPGPRRLPLPLSPVVGVGPIQVVQLARPCMLIATVSRWSRWARTGVLIHLALLPVGRPSTTSPEGM